MHQTKPNQTARTWDMGHGTWDMVAIVVLSSNQSKFFETVAYIKSYEQNRFFNKPNQTNPKFTKTTKNGSPSHMESKSVEIFKIGSLYQKLWAKAFFTKPNQTKPPKYQTEIEKNIIS